jgi:hypothetical protein
MPAKIKPATTEEQALALYADPHLYQYAELVLRERFDITPAQRRYAAHLAHFALDVEVRVHGNRQQAEAANADPRVWATKRRIARDVAGIDLPLAPPSQETVRKWRYALIPPRPTDPDTGRRSPTQRSAVLDALMDEVTRLGYQRAYEFGQFPHGVEPNFAHPDPRHVVVADGTYLKEYSSSSLWVDPDGEAHLLRSRARSKRTARLQDRVHKVTKAGTRHSGALFVVAVTRTTYGRLCLGVGRTDGGESHRAIEIFEKLLAHTGDGLHTICYDQGLTGWPVDWLMAEHGVHVLSTADPKQSKDNKDHPVRVARLDAREAIIRAGLGKSNDTGVTSATTKAFAQKRLQALQDWKTLVKRSVQGKPLSKGQPLGTSLYLSSKNQLVTVSSKYFLHDLHTHLLPGGAECTHQLYVDDGALWEVRHRKGTQVKTQRPRAVTSTRTKLPGCSTWNLSTHYQLICETTGEVLDLHTRWQPRHKRLSTAEANDSSKHRRAQADQALAAMQPLARCDTGFRKAYGLRLDIESWFAWLKHHLANGRAASLDLNHQMLDVLYSGILTNALALRVSRLHG